MAKRRKIATLHSWFNLAMEDVLLGRSSLLVSVIREFKQITTAGATAAAVTEKVWGEYVSQVCQILVKRVKRNTKMKETSAKEFKISFL